MTPLPPIEYILPLLGDGADGPRRAGKGWLAFCPAHDDRDTRSLSVAEGDDGKPLLYCFKGCEFPAIAAAIRALIEQHNSDIFAPDTEPGAQASEAGGDGADSTARPVPVTEERQPGRDGDEERRIVATYQYQDPSGTPLYQVVRYAPKGFSRKYAEGVGKVSTLYRLPELSAAPAGRAVFVVEGEKDADSLASLGLIVTTSGGATSWRPEFADYLAGRRVVIIPDNDAPGRAYASAVATSLRGKAVSVRTVHLPVAPGGDVSDWLAAGHTKQELFDAVAAAREYPPRRWKPLDLSEAKLPPVEGFLNGAIFCRQSLGMIAGRRGVGKTALLMKLTHSIALGSQFGPYPTRNGKVLFMSQEMTDSEIQDRLNRMFTRGERLAINDTVTIICRDRFTIDSDKGVEYLASIVEQVRPDIVFVDALFDVKGAARENDNDEMGAAARRIIEMVCIPFNCCVIVTHHTGRQKEDGGSNPRGASAFEDAAADIMFLERKKDGACAIGSFDPPNGKVRHASVPRPFGYAISSTEDGRIELEIIEDVEAAGDRDGLIRRITDYVDRHGPAGLERLSGELAVSKAALKDALKTAVALDILIKAGTGAMMTWSRPVVVSQNNAN